MKFIRYQKKNNKITRKKNIRDCNNMRTIYKKYQKNKYTI